MIVEDEALNALFLQNILGKEFEVVAIVDNGPEAVLCAKEENPDCILMDIKINGPMDGIETIHQILSEKRIDHIYCTAYSESSVTDRADATKPKGILPKPLDVLALKNLIRN
ncbi:response regulator [Leptospira sarikeiensis]|uniref:response regulator n=1 Tax=Leptospira sarikeiensis TaxID=2484943 RepID=UPI0014382DF7|nr:response regulator [Leptospira sarikeiensis]